MAIISWNKKYTETLAVTVKRFRTEHPEYARSKITYAGRLDPMAEGLVILLTDDDVHQKKQYLALDKIYEVDFFYGVSTDTYDVLGVVIEKDDFKPIINMEKIIEYLQSQSTQSFPPYSSQPVLGKPMWQWAREGTLPKDIPEKSIKIHHISYITKKLIPFEELHRYIQQSVSQVEGNFRQEEIIDSWNHFFAKQSQAMIEIYSLRIHASSGTYMRSLVNLVGEYLDCGATTLKIRRIKVGDKVLT